MSNKRVLGVLVGAAVLVVVGILLFYSAQKKKAHPPPSHQTAQNECATKAYKDYLKNKAALVAPPATDVAKMLSIETTLAKRRLEERYCLQFAECLADPNKPAMVKGTFFSACLRDEAIEQYDAVSREDAEK
jgi:hypothetical protein